MICSTICGLRDSTSLQISGLIQISVEKWISLERNLSKRPACHGNDKVHIYMVMIHSPGIAYLVHTWLGIVGGDGTDHQQQPSQLHLRKPKKTHLS